MDYLKKDVCSRLVLSTLLVFELTGFWYDSGSKITQQERNAIWASEYRIDDF
jgi:hypothetical protein